MGQVARVRVWGKTKMEHEKYFFKDGLRFSCQQCGKCCTGSPGFVFVSEKDIENICRGLNLTRHEFKKQYLRKYHERLSLIEFDDGRCIFWDNGCKIYEFRPYQCRSFPFWWQTIRNEKCWEIVAKKCSGIGKGELHSLEEILGWIKNNPFLKDFAF